jgi:[protein-PII] uridylyltransferase
VPATLPLPRHREKVLAHAERQLASQGKLNSAELLTLYKKFLKIENHRLLLRHKAGGGGRQIAHDRAALLDVILRHLFEAALRNMADHTIAEHLTLVAIGGYGRGELNPFSDVDIMFLQPKLTGERLGKSNDVVQAILYMLWDVGFKVGHSTRTIPAAVQEANANMLSKTSLLEARYLTGNKQQFEEFRREFDRQCVRGHEADYIRQRIENQAERHNKFGRTVYMQEPNVKSGCGGLRDYQNLLWCAYFTHHVSNEVGLVEINILDDTERRQLVAAYDFLLRVRTDLHYLNRRAADILTHPFQVQVASRLAYPQKNVLRRSEAFMKDYYRHARTIFYLTELAAERLYFANNGATPRKRLLAFLRPAKPTEKFDGFVTKDGRIYAENETVFDADSGRLMRLFQHAQLRKLTLSPELQQLVRRRLKLVDRTFQYARANRDVFTAILSRKGEVGRILRMMHELDFLGRYIPEFGQLTCLVQHEFFHRYTADEHTLVCIDKLDELIDTTHPKLQGYRALFQKLDDPLVLYLALLLHDTGKAANAKDHTEISAVLAQKVARRLQLLPDRRRALILLVDQHVLLSNTAQRRNLDDPATITEFASIVQSHRNLDALMLLTLADGQGTGDENWSDWKESLVWQLYHTTAAYLTSGPAFFQQQRVERQELKESVRKKLTKDFEAEIDAHFRYMPESYFESATIAEVVAHLRLFREFLERRFADPTLGLAPAIRWIPHLEQGHSELWIVAWDREGLLSAIAGSLALERLNILSADIYTRGDSLVLDIFRVCNTDFKAVTEERTRSRVEKNLAQALMRADYDFTPQLATAKGGRKQLAQEIDFPTRIAIDNHSHPTLTVVDLQTPDRLGLLCDVLKGFSTLHVNISSSRITTEKGAAIDSFYVTDRAGRKISSRESMARLTQTLQHYASAKP